ncbi:helix-turn-helix domain-containing protein [Enterococcus alishanensis]
MLERQEQENAITKEKGIYKGRPLKYHAGVTGQNKLVYDKVIEMLSSGFPILTIARELNLPRKTIYAIKERT